MGDAASRLVVALDDLDINESLKLVKDCKPFASTYKVGLALFSSYGPQIVREIKGLGVDVFLDLKLHDIPMQVAKSVEIVARLEPKFLTLHALGGEIMLKSAALAAQGSKTRLLAVSVLTSTDSDKWRNLGFSCSPGKSVEALAKLANSCGISDFVSSAHEAARLREIFGSKSFLMTPGIRPAQSENFDQARVMTPYEAITNGASALVIGRPITKALNAKDAAQKINEEIAMALKGVNKNA